MPLCQGLGLGIAVVELDATELSPGWFTVVHRWRGAGVRLRGVDEPLLVRLRCASNHLP